MLDKPENKAQYGGEKIETLFDPAVRRIITLGDPDAGS